MDNQSAILDAGALVLIEEHVRRLLSIMGFTNASVRCDMSAGVLAITIEAGEEGRVLIGPQGSHLHSLQHIVRCVLRAQIKELIHITVDVNGYRLRREQGLLQLAQEVARKAHRTGQSVVMQPMSAADRRAIHAALADQKDIRTESLGDEPNRRVVVRPASL